MSVESSLLQEIVNELNEVIKLQWLPQLSIIRSVCVLRDKINEVIKTGATSISPTPELKDSQIVEPTIVQEFVEKNSEGSTLPQTRMNNKKPINSEVMTSNYSPNVSINKETTSNKGKK